VLLMRCTCVKYLAWHTRHLAKVHELVAAFRDSGSPAGGLGSAESRLHSAYDAHLALREEDRWARIRRRKVARLLGIVYPDDLSAFKAFGGFVAGRSLFLPPSF